MAAAIQTLSQFNLAETDDGYLLEIGGDGGSVLTLAASAGQLDAIVGALQALIAADDSDADSDADDAEADDA